MWGRNSTDRDYRNSLKTNLQWVYRSCLEELPFIPRCYKAALILRPSLSFSHMWASNLSNCKLFFWVGSPYVNILKIVIDFFSCVQIRNINYICWYMVYLPEQNYETYWLRSVLGTGKFWRMLVNIFLISSSCFPMYQIPLYMKCLPEYFLWLMF